jgi:hypothetical protein
MISIEMLSAPGAVPPSDLSPPLQALWWLKQGAFALGPEWEAAHNICQTAEGAYAYDLVHGLAHWIEGDDGNASYWYRRAGTKRAATIAAEWNRIACELTE